MFQLKSSGRQTVPLTPVRGEFAAFKGEAIEIPPPVKQNCLHIPVFFLAVDPVDSVGASS